MRRRDLLARGNGIALALALLPRAARAQIEGLVRELEREIPELLTKTRVPGISIALIQDSKTVWHRGFGFRDATSRIPVDNGTLFEAASMSKPVFAYVVLKLCERGVLDLDTPLTKYTPVKLLEGDARLEQITARHVLSHTSGFQNWRSRKEPLKIHFTPGEQYLYSGEGYHYLQSVVTRLTGHVNSKACGQYEGGVEVCATDFDAHMKANLLQPFGMSSSGYVWTDAIGKRMARSHDAQGRPLQNKRSTAVDVARYGSAGALLTTAAEYAKFLIEVIDPKASDRFRLGRASLREMLRPHAKVTDGDGYSVSWGLGWRIARTKDGELVSHGGDNTGFHSLAEVCVAKKSGYVIMTNGDNGTELLKHLAPSVSRRLYALRGN